jgi:hypothetical protein
LKEISESALLEITLEKMIDTFKFFIPSSLSSIYCIMALIFFWWLETNLVYCIRSSL